MVTTKLNLSMTEPSVRQIYAKQGDTGRVLDITLDQTPEDGTLRILRPDGVEVTSEAVTGGEVESGGTFESLAEADVTELTVGIEPVQDLNGYDKPWVGGAGKNKLPYPYTIASSGTINGVTYTVNGDGSITLTGTATGQVDLALFSPNGYSLDSGTYKITLGGIKNGIKWIYGGSGSALTYNELPHTVADQTFDMTSSGTCGYCIIRIANGTATNTTLYPMIRLATEADATFEPYSNICPITGHDEVRVTRTGKNLFDKANGAKSLYVGGGNVTGSGGTLLCFLAKKGTQYTISMTGGNRTNLYYYDTTSLDDIVSGITLNLVTLSAAKPYTFIAEHDAVYCYYADTNFQQAVADSCMVELGSTATSYEPYQRSTYTTSLGQTVYGGTLDMVTGQLVVNARYLTVNDFSGWGGSGVSEGGLHWVNVPRTYPKGVNDDTSTNVCSHAPYSSNNSTGWVSRTPIYSVNSGGFPARIYVASASLADFRTEYATLQAVYKLAEPVEYQLTAQQIKTLVGTNNVWASSGDIVSIKFTYGGLLSELPSDATSIVGKCYCDIEQNGVSSMPFTLNVKKNERAT